MGKSKVPQEGAKERQDIFYVFAVVVFVLALCSGIKAVCRKILKRGKDYDD